MTPVETPSGTPPPVCAVTGANGYLGSRVCRYFRERGWMVIEMGRRSEAFPFGLGSSIDPSLWKGKSIQALIHCAWDMAVIDEAENQRVNVDGALKLFHSAQNAGVQKLIFVSSMAAFEECKSQYGKSKLEVEKRSLHYGAVAVRPGLIYGNEATGGMFGKMRSWVEKFPLVPVLGSSENKLYLAHEDDVCRLFFELATGVQPMPSEPLVAACPKARSLREILEKIAVTQKRRVLFVPVPGALAWAGLRAIEISGIKLGNFKMRSDSVVSFLNLETKPKFNAPEGFFRDF